MTERNILVLKVEGKNPLTFGQVHGESLRSQVKDMAEIRLELMCQTSEFKKPKDVVSLAENHLPILKAYDPDLFMELSGISQASGVSLPLLMVLNHYTDMRDITANTPSYENEGDCSAIYIPSEKNPLLGQTWDIHGSALNYVFILQLKDALIFSVAGCLGMTGINEHGLGICINNLTSVDAKVGLMWPGLVRACLKDKTAKQAKERILNAPLGSGHHYAVADRHHAFGIETSGQKKKVIFSDEHSRYFHTNHCLDSEMEQLSIIPPESTTLNRYDILKRHIKEAPFHDGSDVFMALSLVSMKPDEKNLNKTTTCGAFVMELGSGNIFTCAGSPSKELLSWPSTKMRIPLKP